MMLSAYLSLTNALDRRQRTTEGGAAAVEYALLAALIALAIVVAVTALGLKLSAVFDLITSKIP